MVRRDAGAGRLSLPRAVAFGAGAIVTAIGVFVINSGLAWRDDWAVASVATRASAVGATLLMAAGLLLLVVLALGRRSAIALWGLVVLSGIAAALTVYRAVSGQLPEGPTGAIALADAAIALLGIALLLVGRGARAWFRERDTI